VFNEFCFFFVFLLLRKIYQLLNQINNAHIRRLQHPVILIKYPMILLCAKYLETASVTIKCTIYTNCQIPNILRQIWPNFAHIKKIFHILRPPDSLPGLCPWTLLRTSVYPSTSHLHIPSATNGIYIGKVSYKIKLALVFFNMFRVLLQRVRGVGIGETVGCQAKKKFRLAVARHDPPPCTTSLIFTLPHTHTDTHTY